MGLAPRSVLHAVHLEFNAPRLRATRIEPQVGGAGDRAMVFEPRPRMPEPDVGAEASASGFDSEAASVPGVGPGEGVQPVPLQSSPSYVSPSEGLGGAIGGAPGGGPGGGRLIDDPQTVGFRQGLLSSARGDYDWFVGAPEHEDQLSQLGQVHRVQVPGGGDAPLPAIQLTPDVRARINGGDIPIPEEPRSFAADHAAAVERAVNDGFSADDFTHHLDAASLAAGAEPLGNDTRLETPERRMDWARKNLVERVNRSNGNTRYAFAGPQDSRIFVLVGKDGDVNFRDLARNSRDGASEHLDRYDPQGRFSLAETNRIFERVIASIDADAAHSGKPLYYLEPASPQLWSAYKRAARNITPPSGYDVRVASTPLEEALGRGHIEIVRRSDAPAPVRSTLTEAPGSEAHRIWKTVEKLQADNPPARPNEGNFGAARGEPAPILGDARQRVVESHVRAAWNGAAAKLMDEGALHVVSTAADLPDAEGVPSWVGAVHYPDLNQVYIIADRVTAKRVQALVLHEVGVHYGLERMLGAKRFQTLLAKVKERLVEAFDDRAEGIDPVEADPWTRAWDEVVKNYGGDPLGPHGATDRHLEEALAHVVEFTDDAQREPADRSWLQKTLDAVKRWFATTFGVGDLSPRDLHTLAVGALRHAGREAAKGVAAEPQVPVPAERLLNFAKARGFDGDDAVAAARWLDQNGYFSGALEAARRFPAEKGAREQMVNWLQSQPGVRADEVKTLGFDEFRDGGKMATKQELIDHIQGHRYVTQVNLKGSLDLFNDARWGNYTYLKTAGDEKPGEWTHVSAQQPRGYFEGLVRPVSSAQPGASWRGAHWREPGVMAHFRGVESTPVDGKAAALIVEVQSDFHDAQPEDYGNISGWKRQRQRDLTELERDFGQGAVDLWRRAESADPDAILKPSHLTGGGALGIYSGRANRGEVSDDHTLRVDIEKHNLRALQLALQRVAGMSPEERSAASEAIAASDELRRRHLLNKRDSNAPFRASWPDVAMREAIKTAVRAGAERVAWSSDAALRTIPGMETYKGSLYDERLPRFVKKWLGVELRSGPIDDARTKLDFHSAAFEAAVDSVAHDAMNNALQINGTKQDLQDDAFVWDNMRHMMEAVDWSEDLETVLRDVKERVESLISARNLGRTSAGKEAQGEHDLKILFHDWAIKTHDGMAAFYASQHNSPAHIGAHYFDVTPELREKILGQQPMFFGAGDRRAAGPDDGLDFSGFGERQDVGPAASPAIKQAIDAAQRLGARRVGDDGRVITVQDGEIEGLTSGIDFLRRTGGDVQGALDAIRERYHDDVVDEVAHRSGVVDARAGGGDVVDGESAGAGEPAKPKPAKKPRKPLIPNAPDYRYRPNLNITKDTANKVIAQTVAGAAAVPLTGVATYIEASDANRRERQAEYDRLAAQAAKLQRRQALVALRAADAQRLRAAVDARDLNALPDMNRAAKKSRMAWLAQATGWAHHWTGVNPDFLQRLITWETANTDSPDARAGTGVDEHGVESGAVGLGQFMPLTWAQALKLYGAQYGVDVGNQTEAQIAQDPFLQYMRRDPRLAVAMLSHTTMADAHDLEQTLGRPVTSAEVYASHFFGIDRAKKFFEAVEHDMPAEQMKITFARERPHNDSIFLDPHTHQPMSARAVMAHLRDQFPGSPYVERPSDWGEFPQEPPPSPQADPPAPRRRPRHPAGVE